MPSMGGTMREEPVAMKMTSGFSAMTSSGVASVPRTILAPLFMVVLTSQSQ